MWAIAINPTSGHGKGASFGQLVVEYFARHKIAYQIFSGDSAERLRKDLDSELETRTKTRTKSKSSISEDSENLEFIEEDIYDNNLIKRTVKDSTCTKNSNNSNNSNNINWDATSNIKLDISL